MKHKRIVTLALTSILSLSVLVPSVLAATPDTENGEDVALQETVRNGRHGRSVERSGVAEPANAIGKDAAKEKALADAGVTAEQAGKIRAHVSQTDGGAVIYKVRFTCDGQRWSYQIDAITGAILDKSTEAGTEHTHMRDGQVEQDVRGRHGIHADKAAETASDAV